MHVGIYLKKFFWRAIFLTQFIGSINALGKSKIEKKTLEKDISFFLGEFVATPHPFGSNEQNKYAQKIKKHLSKAGWDAQVQNFRAVTPSKTEKGTVSLTGNNVIAIKKGKDKCGVVLASHFDTKFFKEFIFRGANDGGSSTAMLLSIAKLIGKKEPTELSNPRKNCSIVLVFFDGEEAILPDWNLGQEKFGVIDHLYGSSYFANSLTKKQDKWNFNDISIDLFMLFDMIGHAKQNLIITQGSSAKFGTEFISYLPSTTIAISDTFIEDDHIPMLEKGINTLHVIDWNNLKEWHTANDTIKIISIDNIANLARGITKFLGY